MKIFSGTPLLFSLETEIPNTDNIVINSSWVANGTLLIGLNGVVFGVDRAEASGLSCSYDQISKIIRRRGNFVNDALKKYSAIRIAFAYEIIEYGLGPGSYEDPDMHLIFEILKTKDHLWVPDGDAAFDDGSVIFHFDIGDQVYLIGYKTSGDLADIRASLTELTILAEQFYSTLESWRDKFEKICGIERSN